jgi:hypothetical protein
MTTNNLQNNPFEKSLQNLRKVSMTPREKGEIFHKLYNYQKLHPVVADKTFYAAFFRILRKAFSPISWK